MWRPQRVSSSPRCHTVVERPKPPFGCRTAIVTANQKAAADRQPRTLARPRRWSGCRSHTSYGFGLLDGGGWWLGFDRELPSGRTGVWRRLHLARGRVEPLWSGVGRERLPI